MSLITHIPLGLILFPPLTSTSTKFFDWWTLLSLHEFSSDSRCLDSIKRLKPFLFFFMSYYRGVCKKCRFVIFLIWLFQVSKLRMMMIHFEFAAETHIMDSFWCSKTRRILTSEVDQNNNFQSALVICLSSKYFFKVQMVWKPLNMWTDFISRREYLGISFFFRIITICNICHL